MDKLELKIKYVKIGDLKEPDYNPRRLSRFAAEQIEASIAKFGIVQPALINCHSGRENIIIGGSQRVKVAKKMGYKEYPITELDVELKDEKELNIRLNKNNGEWDFDKLANYFDMEALKEAGWKEKELIGKLPFEDDDAKDEVILDQAIQLKPAREYVVVLMNETNDEWDEIKKRLKLGQVRRGGYKTTSPYDSTGTQRVIHAKDLLKLLK